MKLVRKTLPALGYRGDDVQVLTPLRKGTLGVDYLNELLQEALNPADPTGRKPELLRGSRRFRIGDRVIQLVNNYDKKVFNGDVGTISDIKPEDQLLMLQYPEGVVEYEFSEYDELQLAYALSIHKSQGSEYRAVVMVLHSSQWDDASAQPVLYRPDPRPPSLPARRRQAGDWAGGQERQDHKTLYPARRTVASR